ncbi:hypothetical protein LINGRAHAP2_LOCUS12504 [Linum grandiflorum]
MQLNSRGILQLICQMSREIFQHFVPLNHIQEMMRGQWEIEFIHVYRKDNHTADYLVSIV